MRAYALLALLVAVPACGSDNSGNGMDLSAVSGDLSAETGDLATGPDLALVTGNDGGYSTDAGGAGAGCMTACDCMPGLGCFGGQCVATKNPVYCCGGSPCPAGDICEHSTGGFGRCGVTGTPDLAGFDHCPLIPCNGANGTARCMQAGCSMCVAGGSGMVCAR
jgi:hypothetical protein